MSAPNQLVENRVRVRDSNGDSMKKLLAIVLLSVVALVSAWLGAGIEMYRLSENDDVRLPFA